jgi:hypothetical protein
VQNEKRKKRKEKNGKERKRKEKKGIERKRKERKGKEIMKFGTKKLRVVLNLIKLFGATNVYIFVKDNSL